MRARPTFVELIVIVCIVAILYAVFTSGHGHRLHPLKAEEMYGCWVSIPSAHSAYRLFLTNGGSGLLGVRDIYTDVWNVVSWQVTNRNLSVDLAPVSHPEWNHEYIRGQVHLGLLSVSAVRGGINQAGERYKVEMIFYPEATLRQDLDTVATVMSDHFRNIKPGGPANGSQPIGRETNRNPSAVDSRR